MTTEQKAKAYDEALKWIESIYSNLSHEHQMEAEAFFSELKESENENIRKAILELVRQSSEILDKQNQNNMIAWLEKQGNQKSKKVSIWKHWKDGICGNGEGKLIYLIKVGDDYSLSSSLGYECDYILLSDLDNLMLEKQCNFTDEDMKEALRTEYEKGRADAFIQIQEEWNVKEKQMCADIIEATKKSGIFKESYKRELVDWIKSIENRVIPQSKQEWSEEDSVRLQRIIDFLWYNRKGDTDAIYQQEQDIVWLKFLKERYTWKPSEKQMNAFEQVYDWYNNNFAPSETLTSLYNDLKKLKEE